MATKLKKKVCPKVTLKLSSDPDPMICTTSNVARDPALKTKTEFTCYQNTSDPSNPRLSSQRLLLMDCDGMQSVGKSWETKIYGTQYMVGVLNKTTNEMELRPASLVNLRPYISSFEEGEQALVGVGKDLSYGEKHKRLAMKFGDSRIQKTIRGKDRVREMERNTLDEAMQEAAVSADTANLTSAPENLTNDILPPINTDAKDLSDVFMLTDLISEAELTALLPFTQVLRETTQAHLDTWKDKYPEYVLSRIPAASSITDEHMAHLYLSELLYISYLLTLLGLSKKRSLKNRKSNFPDTPQVVIEALYRKFTAQGQLDGKLRTSMSDKQRASLLAHTLALTLIVDNYCVPLAPLCRDTGVKLRLLGDTYRSMGCSVGKLKGPGGEVGHVATLKIPVKLPSLVLRKAGKKRER